MYGVTVAAVAASASGKISEDSWGCVGEKAFGAAWVLDGATGLGDCVYVPGAYSDASWYAQQLSEALQRHSLSAFPPDTIFSHAVGEVAQLWQKAVGTADVPHFALPSAAAIWVRWQDSVLEFLSLGDCRGWFMTDDNTIRQLGLLDEEPNDAWLAAQISQHQAEGITAQHMRVTVLEDLRARRSMMNLPSGYWIFGIQQETIQHIQVQRLELSPGYIVLCSDGLFRWVDVYHQGNAGTFVQNCTRDLPSTITHLRQIEDEDADCRKFPRLKSLDDATGLVLQIKSA